MKEQGILKPKSHARILSMIGDQLIRDEKVALMELIKNSYDADASWVQVRFNNFKEKGDELIIQKNSTIEIEDDGVGMSLDTIKKSWVNPASPYKLLMKKRGEDKTAGGRILQGEKGIGRFSAFKLGSTMEIFTKSNEKNSKEVYIRSDLSSYDEELIANKGHELKENENPLYLEDIEYNYELLDNPEVIISRNIIFKNSSKNRSGQGTLIRITNLKGNWSREGIKGISEDCSKLIPPFKEEKFDFDIVINGATLTIKDEKERLNSLLESSPVKIEGKVNKDGTITYAFGNKEKETKSLRELSEDLTFRYRFFDSKTFEFRKPECGPFEFRFYVFNFDPSVSLNILNKDDKDFIRAHRIYVYRDNLRVYPYGDKKDDWLEIDVERGRTKAGYFLSNDQTIGYIGISQRDNPNLKDKTNREGIMENGRSFEDFRTIIRTILGLLKEEFDKFKADQKKKIEEVAKKEGLLITEEKIIEEMSELEKYLSDKEDKKGANLVKTIRGEYQKEKEILNEHIEIVEDLAGVGITVDAASHDLMAMMERAKETLNLLFEMSKIKEVDLVRLKNTIKTLIGQFNFIEDQLQGIQPLFRSSRRRNKDLRIKEIIEKVKIYYNVPINEKRIYINIEEKGSPLIVKCSEGILLQVFINLIDNAVYWLTTSEGDKQIKIIIDGNKSQVIFSDNGPGVKREDQTYIFNPFFSTKGVKGRGLGLYITRQLLGRYDFSINLIENERNKILSGANFLIRFGDNKVND